MTNTATPDLPVNTFREAAPLLRRPFTPAAVKFKPLDVFKEGKGISVTAYIDARLVIERINLVCPHLWTNEEYQPIGGNLMWCRLTIDNITRTDVGEGTGKALVSDALKRAAVHFGVGASLYAIPQGKLWASNPQHLSTWQKGDKWSARIEDGGQLALRQAYTAWLQRVGRQAFGEPLDHGDTDHTQGDADARAAA